MRLEQLILLLVLILPALVHAEIISTPHPCDPKIKAGDLGLQGGQGTGFYTNYIDLKKLGVIGDRHVQAYENVERRLKQYSMQRGSCPNITDIQGMKDFNYRFRGFCEKTCKIDGAKLGSFFRRDCAKICDVNLVQHHHYLAGLETAFAQCTPKAPPTLEKNLYRRHPYPIDWSKFPEDVPPGLTEQPAQTTEVRD